MKPKVWLKTEISKSKFLQLMRTIYKILSNLYSPTTEAALSLHRL